MYFNQVQFDFTLRRWGTTGGPHAMVTNLKKSMMEGRIMSVLRVSLERVDAKWDNFMFGIGLAVPFILHLDNRYNEKICV